MDRQFVIGVDAGGTRTRAAVADSSGQVLGFGQSGAGNLRDVGEQGVAEAVEAAVSDALRAAGTTRSGVEAVFLGIAGVATEHERASIRGIAERLSLAPPERIGVDHDLRVAQAGALGAGPGMVLIVGTGSCCYGRATDGREWRAGGWGSRLDDGGSAADLGRRAIVAAIREADGRGPATSLTSAVLRGLGVRELRGVLSLIDGDSAARARFASLAPAVTEAARCGDAVAKSIIESGAAELALMVGAVQTALNQDSPAESFPLALIGGVLGAGRVVLDPVSTAIRQQVPACRLVQPMLPPVLGAVLLALRATGGSPTDHLAMLLESRTETGLPTQG